MADLSTSWDAASGRGDWVLVLPTDNPFTDELGGGITDEIGRPVTDGLFTGGGIAIGNDLGTAILISLFTDAAAGDDDTIPDGSGDRRGWWGDLGTDRPIGSRIWLRTRSKQLSITLELVKADIADALAWLTDDGVAARIDIATEWTRPGLLGCRVTVHRASGTSVAARFDWAWKEA